MWWELIPPMLGAGVAPYVPWVLVYYMNNWVLGNPMRRDMRNIWDRHMYTRDWRTDGEPWKHKGLDNVPDD